MGYAITDDCVILYKNEATLGKQSKFLREDFGSLWEINVNHVGYSIDRLQVGGSRLPPD
jgi:hypothetical protein